LLWTLARTQEEEVMLTGKEVEDVNTQLLLEDRHVLLKSELDEKLQKKHALELEISKQFMELKRLETSLEKQVFKTVQKE
jgi:hypothetical protein